MTSVKYRNFSLIFNTYSFEGNLVFCNSSFYQFLNNDILRVKELWNVKNLIILTKYYFFRLFLDHIFPISTQMKFFSMECLSLRKSSRSCLLDWFLINILQENQHRFIRTCFPYFVQISHTTLNFAILMNNTNVASYRILSSAGYD